MRKEVEAKMTEAVKLVKVSKSFGKEHVLKEISHSFETGKFMESWVLMVQARRLCLNVSAVF